MHWLISCYEYIMKACQFNPLHVSLKPDFAQENAPTVQLDMCVIAGHIYSDQCMMTMVYEPN